MSHARTADRAGSSAPGALPPLARPDVRRDRRPGRPWSRRSATPSGPAASRTRSSSSGRAARARPRSPGSSPRRVNCTNLQDGDPCDRCASCVSIREGRALDLVEIDAASNRGIDDIRDLRERIHYAPTDLRRKVYILDEAHQITKDAWNALLKSLEEPPDFVVFMFASTHPQEFPPAILSRLQRFDVRRLTVAEIEGKLAPDPRGRRPVDAEPDAVHLIARLAAGGMRDAESMLDQLLASAGGDDRRGGRPRPPRPRRRRGDRRVRRRPRRRRRRRPGSRCSTTLEERGRDLRSSSTRSSTRSASELGRGARRGRRRSGGSALAAAARRLAAIDPERRGVGGLRFQLELALLDAATRPSAACESAGPGNPTARRPAPRRRRAPAARPTPPARPSTAAGHLAARTDAPTATGARDADRSDTGSRRRPVEPARRPPAADQVRAGRRQPGPNVTVRGRRATVGAAVPVCSRLGSSAVRSTASAPPGRRSSPP